MSQLIHQLDELAKEKALNPETQGTCTSNAHNNQEP